MTETDGEWHRSKIEHARVIKRPTRLAGVRGFFNRLMPNIVKPPKDREYLRTASGRELPIHVRIPSAEGVRWAGSTLPLPGESAQSSDELENEWHDPLAVEVGLGVGPRDIPPEGWPDEFDPEISERVLGYLRDE